MADIRPFNGYTPKSELASKVASLPYDVMSSEEARVMAEGNPYSFLHVVKSEIDFPVGVDAHSDEVYQKSADNLKKMMSDGILVRSEKPSFYVYRQKMGNVVQTGIVAGASAAEYQAGLIKKHEHTRKEKEDDRAKHVNMLNANTGPAFLTYPHKDAIDKVVKEITLETPYIDFVSEDGISHTLWLVESDDQINRIVDGFKDVPALYIADGHHRSAAASRACQMRKEANPNHTGNEPYNHFLAVIFPEDQLYVMDYNRVLKDLNGLSAADLKSGIEEKFELDELNVADAESAKPKQRAEFSMYLDGKWYIMTPKAGVVPSNDPVKSLDVSVLQDNVLAPLLGIDDPRTNNRIDFIGGIRGLKNLFADVMKTAKSLSLFIQPVWIN